MERVAAEIQAGERGIGKKDFWGYVWRERHRALTCNGLEWQASEGGGEIIEEDKRSASTIPERP